MGITFSGSHIAEQQLKEIRMQLYHSEQPGFFVFKNFISEDFVKHIVTFWTEHVDGNLSFTPFIDKKHFYTSCPNYFLEEGPRFKTHYKVYHNFFWNKPVDEVTHAVAFGMQQIRNQVESKPVYTEIFPFSGIASSYRMVISKRGENLVPPHTDFAAPENFDPKRLQLTLLLSEKGVDYSGDGFIFWDHQDRPLTLDQMGSLKAGDLILWHYNNKHAVQNVSSTPEQLGFIRIIMPSETIHMAKPST